MAAAATEARGGMRAAAGGMGTDSARATWLARATRRTRTCVRRNRERAPRSCAHRRCPAVSRGGLGSRPWSRLARTTQLACGPLHTHTTATFWAHNLALNANPRKLSRMHGTPFRDADFSVKSGCWRYSLSYCCCCLFSQSPRVTAERSRLRRAAASFISTSTQQGYPRYVALATLHDTRNFRQFG